MKEQTSLGFSTVSSLFVLHNNVPVEMTEREIFDSQKYDTFHGVSYVASPKFFAEMVKDFQKVVFIHGIADSDVSNSFANAVNNILMKPEGGIEFFNQLPTVAKTRVANDSMQIRYGKAGVMIHDKIYLLSNAATGEYRTIIGSANMSISAFGQENRNFENVRIDDGQELYDIYYQRFKLLYEQTNDYIPERSKREYREKKIMLVVDTEEQFNSLLDKIEENRSQLVINEDYKEQLSALAQNLKKKIEVIDTAKHILEALVTKKRSNGTYGLKQEDAIRKQKSTLQNFLSKNKKENVAEEYKRERLLPSEDEFLYKYVGHGNDGQIIYSKSATAEQIALSLRKIDAFTKAYHDFALSPNWEIPAKVYEAIMYTFTSPFIWRIKQICAMEYNAASVSDIPMFLVIGGMSESGKTTLLSFLAEIIGVTESDVYDFARDLDKAGALTYLLEDDNNRSLIPIFADELSTGFFGKSGNSTQKGEALIKRLSNMVPEKPIGTLIGTTNHEEFYSTSQVVRRIYYLSVNNKFDHERKTDSMNFIQEIKDSINDSLFRDFSYRFGQELRNHNPVYRADDFMFLTRRIFLDYYRESGFDPPKYFPRTTFNDYGDRRKIFWRQLFLYNREFFTEIDDKIRVDINGLVKESVTGRAKYKEQLLSYLDDTCLDADSSVGLYLFLKRDAFYNFIEYENNILKRTFSGVTPLIKNVIRSWRGE